MTYTYIVSIFERFCNPWIHIMMIQSHEKSVDHYTQGNKEVDERIKDDERQVLEEREKGRMEKNHRESMSTGSDNHPEKPQMKVFFS